MTMWRILTIVLVMFFLYGAKEAQAKVVITGNVISYGTRAYTGLRTGNFTLTLDSWTPTADAQRYLGILQESGQDRLLDTIRKQDIGNFSINNSLARDVNVAIQNTSGGQVRIYAVFERWEQFAEVRGGYRSLDYPFGYIELTVDQRTGKGSGQYFAAAKISWKDDKKDGYHVEVEDYATYPAKLENVEIKGPL